MEPLQGEHKEPNSTSEDIISSLPKNLVASILDRMPIQDAVKTSILSRNWRSNWTLLSQLVFDQKFCDCLRTKGLFMTILYRILLHLKGAITRFVLYVPEQEYNPLSLDDDINHLILFLSTKGMKEFTLMNMCQVPLKLSTHLSSHLELKYLKLRNCHIRLAPAFLGFPKLKEFQFEDVICENTTAEEFITGCPLLEILELGSFTFRDKVKPFQIAKLQNLKRLSLSLCKLDTIAVTSSDIIWLISSLPKLEELCLDFHRCKFLAEANAAGKRVPATFRCLKSLVLKDLDFSMSTFVLCSSNLIRSSPNLQTLKITATDEPRSTHPEVCSWEADWSTMKQLQIVELISIKGLKNEIGLIKFLLEHSPFLKTMVINRNCPSVHKAYTFSRKLLKLHRASAIAEIQLYP